MLRKAAREAKAQQWLERLRMWRTEGKAVSLAQFARAQGWKVFDAYRWARTLRRASVLEAENAHLKNELAAREARLLERESRIRLLEEALRAMKADRWGASREKLSDVPGQSLLFNEAEVSLELAGVSGAEVALTATPLREDKPASTITQQSRIKATTICQKTA